VGRSFELSSSEVVPGNIDQFAQNRLSLVEASRKEVGSMGGVGGASKVPRAGPQDLPRPEVAGARP
jgi:hypothetical protein